MKRVLIISYYWPPGGGAGVQRWLKFTKYLPEHGWQPVVYTPSGSEQTEHDASLMQDLHPDVEVIRRPIWEPYEWYKTFIGQDKKEKINTGFLSEKKKPSRMESIAVWIRGNLFIPDARKYWIKPSIEFLSGYLKENPVDLIISTGPPHSMHLIAMGLKKNMGSRWIADFRDPWTGIDFYDDLKLSKAADKKHHRLEQQVLTNADVVVSVGRRMAEEFKTIGAENVEVIPNGYDSADFDSSPPEVDSSHTISHIGSMTRTRNPDVLWQALASLKVSSPELLVDFKIQLVGKVDIAVRERLGELGLEGMVDIFPYRPHEEIVKLLRRSRGLLLVVNRSKNQKGIVTGKIFEYLASRRPIVCIGPRDGEAAMIIEECAAGATVGYEDVEGMKRWLTSFLRDGSHHEDRNEKAIHSYDRKALTGRLAGVMGEVSDSDSRTTDSVD